MLSHAGGQHQARDLLSQIALYAPRKRRENVVLLLSQKVVGLVRVIRRHHTHVGKENVPLLGGEDQKQVDQSGIAIILDFFLILFWFVFVARVSDHREFVVFAERAHTHTHGE